MVQIVFLKLLFTGSRNSDCNNLNNRFTLIIEYIVEKLVRE